MERRKPPRRKQNADTRGSVPHLRRMERWKIYALFAALFAGLTSVVAKAGLKNLSADLGLAVRSMFVCAFVLANLFIWTDAGANATALRAAGGRTIGLLALSALTTTLSWVCYYRAMK